MLPNVNKFLVMCPYGMLTTGNPQSVHHHQQ